MLKYIIQLRSQFPGHNFPLFLENLTPDGWTVEVKKAQRFETVEQAQDTLEQAKVIYKAGEDPEPADFAVLPYVMDLTRSRESWLAFEKFLEVVDPQEFHKIMLEYIGETNHQGNMMSPRDQSGAGKTMVDFMIYFQTRLGVATGE